MSTFKEELRSLLNRFSCEAASDTPDFVLADYLQACLAAFNTAVQQRETWYGRDPRPTSPFTSGEPLGQTAASTCQPPESATHG